MVGTTSVEVKVPKNLQGKVIGRKGATLQDIESDYPGVKVRVPSRNDPSDIVVVEGPADAVTNAKNRILDICGMAPDISGGHRKRAQELFDEANRLFEASDRASNHSEKSRLKSQAHDKLKEAKAANSVAAEKIFAAKNAGYGNDQMDLHGLQVKEAMKFVQDRLVAVDGDLRSGSLPNLTIITGAGHHSENHKAKIKPEIKRYLEKEGYPFYEDESGGMFIVEFAKDGTVPSQPPVTQPPEQQPAPEEGDKKKPDLVIELCKCLVTFCINIFKKPASPEPTRSMGNENPPREQEMTREEVAQI